MAKNVQHGLSIAIDETVTCALGIVSEDRLDRIAPLELSSEKTGERFGSRFLMERFEEIDNRLLHHGFGTPEKPISFLVISTIGLVDMDELAVRAIARPGWPELTQPLSFRDLLGARHLRVLSKIPSPVLLINDASAVAVAEYEFGAGKDIEKNANTAFAVLRLGEGLNAGLLIGGKVWRGGLHPEFGHMISSASEAKSSTKTGCLYHGTECFEALISEHAILERCGRNALTPEYPGREKLWEILARDLSELCVSITLMLAPEQIVLAGKIPDADLADRVRKRLLARLGGYPSYPALTTSKFIRRGAVRSYANNIGALEIGRQAFLC